MNKMITTILISAFSAAINAEEFKIQVQCYDENFNGLVKELPTKKN